MVASIHGSLMVTMSLESGQSAGLWMSRVVPLRSCDLVDHARRGGDEVEVIFAGQPLLDDLQVEEAEEAAAEAEAEGGAGSPSRS